MSASRREVRFEARGSVDRRFRVALAGFAALALVSAGAAGAQSYEVPWATIDDGGTSANGAPFVLRGTMGQLDAGPQNGGGTFDLLGGFWPGVRELRRAMIFGDGFEAGNTSAWSLALPLAPGEAGETRIAAVPAGD